MPSSGQLTAKHGYVSQPKCMLSTRCSLKDTADPAYVHHTIGYLATILIGRVTAISTKCQMMKT